MLIDVATAEVVDEVVGAPLLEQVTNLGEDRLGQSLQLALPGNKRRK